MLSPCLFLSHCAVLLDKPRNAWYLLALLIILNAGYLYLVIAITPFRDSNGHTGWTTGDKAQVVAQLGLLVECVSAALCLPFGVDVPVVLQAAAIVLSLGAVIFPIFYMWSLNRGNDMLAQYWPQILGRYWPQEGETQAVESDKKKDGGEDSVTNPAAAASE
eukprot:COSAG02_NODE_6293_length_3672_cov_2.687086_3_plen_162_part_00